HATRKGSFLAAMVLARTGVCAGRGSSGGAAVLCHSPSHSQTGRTSGGSTSGARRTDRACGRRAEDAGTGTGRVETARTGRVFTSCERDRPPEREGEGTGDSDRA